MDVTSSTDGTKLAAVVGNGQIFTSNDAGATWVPRATSGYWLSVSSSSDGGVLVAAGTSTKIFTSVDSGVSWTAHENAADWTWTASSDNGIVLYAGGDDLRIYRSDDSGVSWQAITQVFGTTMGTVGYLEIVGSNNPLGSLELLYVGGGRFLLMNNSLDYFGY